MKIDYDFKTFIDKFKEEFPGFILRVRDLKDNGNIAYYNGIKAFTVKEITEKEKGEKKELKKVVLDFPINTYKCNVTSIKECTSKQELKEYRENIYNLCENMSNLYDFSMSYISYENAKEYNPDETEKRMKKFIDKANEYKNYKNFKIDIKQEKNKIVFAGEMSIYQIIMMQYYFLYYMKINETKNKDNTITLKERKDTIKNIKFNFEANYRKNRSAKEDRIKNFREGIVNSINKYEGKGLLEKKYQHIFMLQGKDSNIFTNKSLEHFEEEYGITNKKREKSGRIDCIFYDYAKDELKNIYLLEMKVDDPVILGMQGVLTHLDDIKELLKDEKQINKLIERIEYRHKMFSGKKLNTSKFKDEYNKKIANIHFYTIVGYTTEDKINSAKDKLNSLLSEEKIQKIGGLPKWAFDESQTIPKTMDEINNEYPNTKIKFFIESTSWKKDGDITNEFKEGIINKNKNEFEWKIL